MAHLRQQIREYIGGTLVSGLTTTGTRVYQSRLYPMADDNLPGLLVYTTTEESEPDVMGSTRNIDRAMNLVIEGFAKTATNLDDKLDTIADEVETAMAGSPTINSLAKNSWLASTEIALMGEGETPVGVITMNYSVIYRTRDSSPDTAA